MDNCQYCEAVKGKQVLYADAELVALLAKPASVPGHVKIIPKQHHTIFEQVPDSLVRHLFQTANKFSTILFEALSVQGTNVIVENGSVAGQKIPHFSIDVIPRRENDNLVLQWPPKKIPEEQMSSIEIQLQEDLQRPVSAVIEMDAHAQVPADEGQDEEEDSEDYMVKNLNRIP